MKTLLIMRHAKSSWKEPGMADHDRPLNKRGKRAAPRMGELLDEHAWRPERVLSSTATRARETAVIVAKNCGAPEVELFRELYLADAATYLEVLRQQGDELDCLMVVGHNPGLEYLVSTLTGADESLPTAAIAVVHLAIDRWAALDERTSGELHCLWRPRELED